MISVMKKGKKHIGARTFEGDVRRAEVFKKQQKILLCFFFSFGDPSVA